MVRDVLGSLLLLGGALWLWLGLVQAQRRQLRLLEELAASLEQMASAIRFRRGDAARLLAAQRQRPLADRTMERCWRRWRRASLFRRHGGRALRLSPGRVVVSCGGWSRRGTSRGYWVS